MFEIKKIVDQEKPKKEMEEAMRLFAKAYKKGPGNWETLTIQTTNINISVTVNKTDHNINLAGPESTEVIYFTNGQPSSIQVISSIKEGVIGLTAEKNIDDLMLETPLTVAYYWWLKSH